MAHTYDVGTKAWQPDPTEGWVASEVEHKTIEGDKVKLVFQLANGDVRTIAVDKGHMQQADIEFHTVEDDNNNTGCSAR